MSSSGDGSTSPVTRSPGSIAIERRPCRLDYRILCAADWRTESARISGVVGERDVDLRVSVDRGGKWFLNDTECPAVSGCIDIDLGFSPSTNLIPIRRLSLAIGQHADVRAAWLPFPALVFEALPQVYRREAERVYRYESVGGAFVRLLTVNAAGFVTDYPGFWIEERG